MTTISTYNSGKKLLVHCLSEICKQATGQTLYARELTYTRDQYPFFTFLAPINRHEEILDHPVVRPYQIMLQLDAHSRDYWQADQLAGTLYNALQDPGYQRFLKQCHMAVGPVNDVVSHNAVVGSNYDYAMGFDATFNVLSGLTFDTDKLNFDYQAPTTIDTATINDINDGSQISSNKQQ